MEIAIDHLPSKKVLERLEASNDFEPSFPIVMASAAGWYVGQIYVDNEFQFIGPYDRLTYYMTKADAIALWEFDWREEWEQVYGGSL